MQGTDLAAMGNAGRVPSVRLRGAIRGKAEGISTHTGY